MGEIAQGKFIEYAHVHGNIYGTSIAAVRTVKESGKICILDIDVQGVRKVKESTLDPHYIFIAPPSRDALESRLRRRGSETESVITNDKLDAAFQKLIDVMQCWYPQLKQA